MEIINAGQGVMRGGTAVALGNFDGLHTAHMRIIRRSEEIAREKGLKSGVLLFEENTKSVVFGSKVKLITPYEEKLRLLCEAGVDFVYTRTFTEDFMRLSPEEFVRLLIENLNVKAVCVGYDYSFGHMASGNTETLTELGKKYGFETFVTPRVIVDSKTVSSTYIRELVSEGRTDDAARYLGRHYSICGTVAHGFQNGRKMGFPTANIECADDVLLPKEGVYAGVTEVLGKRYVSVVNVGKNLTFGAEKPTIESHLTNFDANIYGERIRVYFYKRLRDVMRFDGIDALKEQIHRDVRAAMDMRLICG